MNTRPGEIWRRGLVFGGWGLGPRQGTRDNLHTLISAIYLSEPRQAIVSQTDPSIFVEFPAHTSIAIYSIFLGGLSLQWLGCVGSSSGFRVKSLGVRVWG